MKSQNLFTMSILVALLLLGTASATASPEKTGQGLPQTCIGGKDGVKEELFRASQEAAKRIVAAYSSYKEFNPRDVRLANAARVACSSAAMKRAAETMISSEETVIKRGLLDAARETASRVLANYNASDGDFEAKRSDLLTLEIFQNVIMAADCLKESKIPLRSAKIDSNLAGKAVEAARRVIAAFNQDGWNANFNANDLETLRAFQKAVRPS